MVARDRDVQAFGDRAASYEAGYRGQMHSDIVGRSIDLALGRFPPPQRVLDVGCGTGLLLRELARRLPEAISLTGIDAAAEMVGQAAGRTAAARAARLGPGAPAGGVPGTARTPADAGTLAGGDSRLVFLQGVAEHLPFPDRAFDLVISTTSFDHWADQAAGLAECRRVLAPGGHLVLTDLFSSCLLPTLVGTRRNRARTPLRATRLLAASGFRSIRWHRLYAVIIRSVTASA